MGESRNQKGDQSGYRPRYYRSRCRVDVSLQEEMHWAIPLPAEFEPVRRVPPIRVEVTVGKASDLREGTKQILKDDQEDQQEGDHERKQQLAHRLGKDETLFKSASVGTIELDSAFIQYGKDEVLSSTLR